MAALPGRDGVFSMSKAPFVGGMPSVIKCRYCLAFGTAMPSKTRPRTLLPGVRGFTLLGCGPPFLRADSLSVWAVR